MSEENEKVDPNQNEKGDSTSKFQDEMIGAIQIVRNMCEELLKKQKTLESSNVEIVEKLRLAEEKMEIILQILEEDTFEEELTDETSSSHDDSVTPSESSDEKSSQILPMTGKCFVLKHVFTDVLQMKEKLVNDGNEEEHFGVTWQLILWKQDNQLSFFFKFAKSLSVKNCWISLDAHFKLISTNGKCHYLLMRNTRGTHGKLNDNSEFDLYGAIDFIEWNKMKEEFLDDGKLTVEIHVIIKKMAGIYKNDLKSFGDEMKPFSDVVLVVNEKKFFVLKLYLAGHSPYFNSLLMGHFQESKKSEIKLTGIDADDFQNYLEVLYAEHSIDEITVEGILLVADMYETPLVICKCEEFLLEKSKKTLKKKLQMSTRYNLQTLAKKWLSEIKTAADLKSVIPGDIHDLDPLIMVELLQRSLALH